MGGLEHWCAAAQYQCSFALDVLLSSGRAGALLGSLGCSPACSAKPIALSAIMSHLASPLWMPSLPAGSLLPGQLVTARVRNVLSDGLLCSFLTYFR
jgi:hypothetical protein